MELFPVQMPATGSKLRLTQPQFHSLVTTDVELIVYTIARYGATTEEEAGEEGEEATEGTVLDVVALNVSTGTYTQISTGIHLVTQVCCQTTPLSTRVLL